MTRLLTPDEGRAMLGFRTLSGFYRYVRRNHIESEKHDGHKRFSHEALLRPRPARISDYKEAGREFARELRRA